MLSRFVTEEASKNLLKCSNILFWTRSKNHYVRYQSIYSQKNLKKYSKQIYAFQSIADNNNWGQKAKSYFIEKAKNKIIIISTWNSNKN